MSKTIFFFVKIFSEKSYAEEFLKGSLYSNRLAFFKKLDETAQANRGDKHEAVVGWYQPDQIRLVLNGHEFKDLAAPISLQKVLHDELNVFCIYAAHSGHFKEVTDENIFDLRDHLRIPSSCLMLGDYAVVVRQAQSFIDRVVSAVKDKNYGLKAGLVEYYDPSLFSGSFSDDEAVFRKRKEFEHQREYRFSFETGISGNNPIKLEIGDISDIALICETSEVNNLLKVRLPDGSYA